MTDFHARRFDRAASTYADHAAFQARMADRLADLLPAGAGGPAIEFGCGTGLLTARLLGRLPDVTLLATDAAPRMARRAALALGPRARLAFAVCDASGLAPGGPRGRFGLAASNAMVQWFPDLGRHLRWAASLLVPGGTYLVSGFDRSNFPELNSILREPPFGYSDFPGHPAAGLEALAAEAGLGLSALETERRETVAPSPRAFLEAIRSLGAARRPGDRPLTRSRLDRLLRTYQERYPREGGVAATWMPWYAAFRKPA